MKVLHLFQEYLAFSEAWCFNLLDSMDATSHAIGAFYFSQQKQFFSEKFDFINHPNLLPNQKYYQASEYLSLWEKLRIKIEKEWMNSEEKFFNNWISQNKPDLLHFHFATTAAKLTKLLDLEIPTVVSFYGFDYEQAPYQNPKLKRAYQNIFKKADLLLTEGEHGRLQLIKQGCKPEKIKISRLGVEIGKEPEPKTKGDSIRLIQIANFLPKKGQSSILEACRRNYKEWKDRVFITFIGNYGNKYGEGLLNEYRELIDKEMVEIRQPIPYSKIQNELKKHDVFIHPSTYGPDRDCEGGAPTILFDAQMAGLPIISTNHCDIPSSVPPSIKTRLVESENIDMLVNEVNHYLKMEESVLNSIRNECFQHVKENFDINKNGAKLELIYKDLITKN